MIRKCLVPACTALLLWGSEPVHAQVPVDEARQRAAIRAERDAAESLYREREVACNTKFVVASCVEEARQQHHDTVKQLDLRQAALDDALREARTAQRRAEIASKESAAEARRRDAQPSERSSEAKRGAVVKQPAASSASAATPARQGKAQPSPEARAAEETRARNAYTLKQLQAEARRQEAARRNAEQAKKTKPAAPLPVPDEEVPAPAAKASGQVLSPPRAASAP